MNSFPFTLIDLTHTLETSIPSWSGGCGFDHRTKLDYDEGQGEIKFKIQKLTMHAGIGTHLDAPAHCVPGGANVDELSLESLAASCVMINVASRVHERFSLSPQDIMDFELTHGRILPKSLVMIHTGWDRYWTTPSLYRNNHIFPSVSPEAAHFLLERQVVGLGIDTLSPDRPEDGFLVHKYFLEANKYLIENATHLGSLPPTGSFVLGLPLKIRGGTEAPMRLVGLVKKTECFNTQ